MSSKTRKTLRAAAGAGIIGIVAYFFWRALRNNWAAIQETDLHLGWWTLAVVALFVFAVSVSGALWGRIVRQLEQRPLSTRESVQVHFLSWLLKYIPGQVGFVMNKVLWGKRRNTSRTLVLLSVVYENAFLLLGSIVPMLAILVAAQAVRGEDFALTANVWIAIAAIVPLLIVTQRSVFSKMINVLAKRALGRPVPHEYFLSSRDAFIYQLQFLLPRIINGVGIAIIAVAIADAAPDTWLPLGAAYAIAGAIGILAVFVPSGLGVREAVFVALAAPYLTLETAIVISLAARVLSTLGDAAIAAIYGALRLGARTEG